MLEGAMMKARRLFAVAVIVAAITALVSTNAYASTGHFKLNKVKHATARFQSLSVAQKAGYSLLVDKDGIACIDMPPMGAMGVHYVRGDLVGDGKIDPLHPEAVVYEPVGNKKRLVALEYVVIKADWDKNHKHKPSLFGHTFNTTPAGNRYGLPDFYSLHVWIFKDNPAGTFAMWNPRVHCPGSGGHSGHTGH
jgi:hypothetical protein